MTKVTPMMAQWASCKAQSHGALVLFRLGDFYEAFHEDAHIVSQALDLTLTKRQEVPMCGIPWHASDGYIDRLIQRGHAVALAEQIQGGDEEENRQKGLVERKVVKIFSPGTTTSPSLLQEHNFHYIASLSGHPKSGFGLALIDMTTGTFSTLESPSDQSPKVLLQELVKRRPKEVVVSRQFLKAHSNLMEELEASCTFRKTVVEDWYFDTQLATKCLECHFQVHSLGGFGLSAKPLSTSAAGALLAFIRDILFHDVSHLQTLRHIETLTSLQLDVATLRNLDIFEVDSKRADAKSLFQSLNMTKTPMGARLLRSHLLSPLLSLDEIAQRHDTLDAYISRLKTAPEESWKVFFSALSSVRDLERLAQRVCSQTASPRDIRFLASCLSAVEEAQTHLASLGREKDAALLPPVRSIVERIEATLVEEPPLRLSDGEVIKRGVDPSLDELKEMKVSSEAWLAAYQTRLREELGIKTLKIGFTRVFGYYIEVPKNAHERVPPSFSRRQTLSTGERYTCQELSEFEKKILSAESKIQCKEASLFNELVANIRLEHNTLLHAARVIAQIDLSSSLAKIALDRNYVRPTFTNDLLLDIKGGRHPVAELVSSKPFVPNDLLLSATSTSCALITGPNMGGKSTYIRMVALLAIMAQMGSFIPATSATMGLVDKVMSRVGASDDLASGQSTFMVEMTETAHILNTATKKSLILLDEIGRGTSTNDGLSLAWAVTEFLTASDVENPRTLFATHYHELTDLEGQRAACKNYTVAVNEAERKIQFLYKVLPGKADKSYGIHVAELAGLPKSVVERARHLLDHLERKSRQSVAPKEDLFGPVPQSKEQLHAEKALSFLRSLDLTKTAPLDCFLQLLKFHEELKRKK